MSKVSIDDVAQALVEAKVELSLQHKIIESLSAAVQEKAAQKEEAPKAGKRQYVIVVSDPSGRVAAIGDLAGWVFQIDATRPAAGILDDVRRVGVTYNETSRKGKENPVKSVGEAVDSIERRFWVAQDGSRVLVKTKIPVQVVVTDNRL